MLALSLTFGSADTTLHVCTEFQCETGLGGPCARWMLTC